MKLTEQQRKSYIEGGGNNCPVCNLRHLDIVGRDYDGNNIFEYVHCTTCDSYWTDVYTLNDVILEDEEESDEINN